MKEDRVISRRSFLKGGAALVGAGALVGGVGVGSLVQAKGGPPAPPEPEPLGFLPIDNVGSIDPDEVRRLVWNWYFTGGG